MPDESCPGCGLTRAVHDPDESWFLHQASCLRGPTAAPLITATLGCACDLDVHARACARCESLMSIHAASWQWRDDHEPYPARRTGQALHAAPWQPEAEPWTPTSRGVLRGLGYTLLGFGVCLYSVVHYALWTLPRAGWLHYTGQIPPPRDPGHWRDTNREGKL